MTQELNLFRELLAAQENRPPRKSWKATEREVRLCFWIPDDMDRVDALKAIHVGLSQLIKEKYEPKPPVVGPDGKPFVLPAPKQRV